MYLQFFHKTDAGYAESMYYGPYPLGFVFQYGEIKAKGNDGKFVVIARINNVHTMLWSLEQPQRDVDNRNWNGFRIF